MATLTRVALTCDICGDATDVQTQTIGLDGKTYEIDLCRKDAKRLDQAVAGYVSKARKSTASPSRRRNSRRPRSRADTAATGPGNERGIYVYGILPADIEVAADMPGVGESPGLLRVVRSEGVAALISEVDMSRRLGSPDDLRTHREILDATATEVPVLPLRFGAVLASEAAVAEELLAAHRDEFADALEQLEGRAEFVVKGRYLSAAVTAGREEDTRALVQAMDGHCVASVELEPARELDAVHVAFLAEADKESDVEQVVEELARDWEGRIEVQLLGPMAAYDFAGTTARPGATEAESAERL
jgi:hypothetical protein